MSESRELAVIGKTKDAKAEKVEKTEDKITPPVEVLLVHSALLLAAESTIAKDTTRPALTGVFLHRVEKVGRVVATDGNRMFVGSFALPTPMPSWLKEGVILNGEGLRKRVQLIVSQQDDPMIRLAHTKGSGFFEMSDLRGDAVFKVGRIAMPFANYEGVLGQDTFVNLDEDGNVRGREFEPVGINSVYLKHCGDIAKMLEAGLPKKERTKTGMVVRAYTASSTSPMVFDFSSWPGALLVVMPFKLADSTVSKATAVLMAPATKLTIAALRAHATRQLAWAEEATDPATKAVHEAKAAGFVERIAAILTNTQGMASIGEAKASPKSTPEPTERWEPKADAPAEPVADADPVVADPPADAADEPTDKPAIKRTKIKVNRNKAA